MANEKVHLALLGCGDVAQRDYLPEFHRLGDRAEIVAVCGRGPERARQVAEQYAIPHWYTDYSRMLAESDADAVINLTPIQLHTEMTLAALQAGKHVYTEKPIASTVADALRIRQEAENRGLVLVCAPCVCLFPQVRYAQEQVQTGRLGPIFSARAYAHMGVPPWHGYTSDPAPFFAQGGGPAFDMGVYPLHVLTGLLGPVRRVTAMVGKVFNSFVVEDGPFEDEVVTVEADDNWQMLLDFGGGLLASLAANSVVLGSRAPQVEIHGLLGTVALNPIDVAAPVELLRAGEGWRSINPPPSGRASGPDHHLGVEHLVECIETGRMPLLGAAHALHVIDILEKAARSSTEGRALDIEHFFRREE